MATVLMASSEPWQQCLWAPQSHGNSVDGLLRPIATVFILSSDPWQQCSFFPQTHGNSVHSLLRPMATVFILSSDPWQQYSWNSQTHDKRCSWMTVWRWPYLRCWIFWTNYKLRPDDVKTSLNVCFSFPGMTHFSIEVRSRKWWKFITISNYYSKFKFKFKWFIQKWNLHRTLKYS